MAGKFFRKLSLVTIAACCLIGLSSLVFAETKVSYFHNDVAGTPMLATDSQGNLLWKENYQPFGHKFVDDPGSKNNKLWFTGKPYEETTGLSYMGARYYDPLVGRFNGVDPEDFDPANLHSFNRYAYANNNPYKFVDPDGHSPLDVTFLAYDVGKLGYALYKGEGVGEAVADVVLSAVGVASPIPGAGQALKAARAADKGIDTLKGVDKAREVAKTGGKPDFIVSPNGTTIPTNKDFNLVDSNKKGGDWFQIHNKHTDAKVDGSPHTHYPKRHDRNTTREIKRTDGADLDHADNMLRNGTMRQRRNRSDKGG